MPPASPATQRWFAEEVLPHEDALRAFLHARFKSLEGVDDLVQEAYIRLLRAHESGPLACPRAYLFITAKNLALRSLRQQQREALSPWPEAGAPEVPVDHHNGRNHLEKNETISLLTQAIQSLPDRCRQIITLRKIYGLSQREVARELRISENTVEAQSVIGMRRCAEFLQRHGLPGKNPPASQ